MPLALPHVMAMEDERYCHSPEQYLPPNKSSHIYSAGIFMYCQTIDSFEARTGEPGGRITKSTDDFLSLFFLFSPGIGDCFRAPSGFDYGLSFLFRKRMPRRCLVY
ncbi:hypothetical protein CDAR_225921 [Caerostris darwini]|uniref:Uncharacterized protein n=1 Tax=Caerostris darwini TaxID=1538125 RepID=A0AAV4M3L1_9ARAC|nr:hypothetical protein CDAR_225921 [Caerostris darwini]